ncbi:MAG TPA: enoyl-ACP reductase FabI [Acidimicrobiales bacterium]|nr:enoyl-ACP reductase FabI [Acidimicrobiales bacterium]
MSGLLVGRCVLVTGVLTDDSLAFSCARYAQEQGAEVVLSGFGRGLSLTERTSRRLPAAVEVLELDATLPEQAARAAAVVGERYGRLDGLVHAIGFAPESCLGQGMLAAPWEDVARTIEVSAYSLKTLAEAFLPWFERAGGGSIVGLDFDAATAWPAYDWMGVAKATLESLTRYLARDLGPRNVRVNLIASGPVRTVAAKSIPGFSRFDEVFSERAPLGWDVRNADAVGQACAVLLSDWLPRTTGEILHVDGGFHAVAV